MALYPLLSLVFLAFVFMVLLFFGFWRYLQYRETMALAKQGLIKPEESGNEYVAGALVFLAVGLALLVGLYPIGRSVAPGQFAWGLGPWMLPGFLFTFLGLALSLHHLITRVGEPNNEQDESESLPGSPPDG